MADVVAAAAEPDELDDIDKVCFSGSDDNYL